jgi:hypothetical protein
LGVLGKSTLPLAGRPDGLGAIGMAFFIHAPWKLRTRQSLAFIKNQVAGIRGGSVVLLPENSILLIK